MLIFKLVFHDEFFLIKYNRFLSKYLINHLQTSDYLLKKDFIIRINKFNSTLNFVIQTIDEMGTRNPFVLQFHTRDYPKAKSRLFWSWRLSFSKGINKKNHWNCKPRANVFSNNLTLSVGVLLLKTFTKVVRLWNKENKRFNRAHNDFLQLHM